MITLSKRYVRPALWGFFICIAAAIFLLFARTFIPSYEQYRWNTERVEQRTVAARIIHHAFQARIEKLAKIAENVSRDTSFSAAFHVLDNSAALKLFQSLRSYKLNEDQSIDLVDSSGNLIAWSGPSIASGEKREIDPQALQPFTVITQNGLRTYLTVGRRIADARLFVLASEPLEVNSPISNRFVQKVSLCAELGELLNTQITLRLPQTYKSSPEEYNVPVTDQSGKTIAEFFVMETAPAVKISSDIEKCDLFIAVCLAIACVFLAVAGISWIETKQWRWITTAWLIISLWIVRFVWRELNFPSAMMNGWIFNPNLYASPFILGFTSSLGELILTVLTAALSVWFLLSRISWSTESERPYTNYRLRGKIGSTAVVLFSSLLLLWVFRGFGEAVRSMVFDSTIRFNNPSEFLPDGSAALMYFTVILLGASLLGVSALVFLKGGTILANHFLLDAAQLRIVHYGMVLLSIPIFAFLDDTRFIPLVCSTFFAAASLFFMEVMSYWQSIGTDKPSHRWKLLLWMTVASFVMGAPLIHQELQQRERREVEAVENVYLRPSDSWLTYVVQDGLRSSVESFAANRDSYSFAMAREYNLAFVLWAKTLIGKEGYNSGLILYNPQGIEVDQFIVGMNKPEQQNILTNVFAGEEEAVHVVNQADPRTLGKLYGGWTTIRDSSGQLLGSIALVLSEHQKGIFHGEDSEPLRQFGDLLENDVAREIAVHEFIRDSLVFSTGRKLYPERLLSASIDSELQNTKNQYLWKDLSINGYRSQTVFSKDPASPERIAAISLEELDFRWDLFGYIKEFFICLAILVLMGIGLAFRKILQKEIPAMGFRGKLLLGFACITLIPLVILSTYNKELVSDRVQMQGAALLYDDLAKLEDRISAYVSDEEDFVKGIDDDFCEALAAEYGIDFSIYRGASIQASSRPELYRASLLDGRLNGGVYASTVLDGKTQVLSKEKIGSVEYVVGYTPFFIHGRAVGVIAVPTLKREKEIEAELAQQNAYVFSMYAIIFGIALAGGGFLALRFARPLQSLTSAAKNVAEGNLDITVSVKSHDEIGTLAQSFNDMILKLRASREELAKHERENAWKEMAKQVAHEIKNPLTPMKLSMQHLRQAFKDNAPGREEILQRVTQTVIDQIDALSRIASEFSHFAKMPEGKFERVNIDQLLNETINLFKEVEGITFINHLASPSLGMIADRDQLRGVFINIFRNAIQAIEETGTITLKTSKEGRWCVIVITDTGHGIPEEIRSRIFEPNFSTKSEGMGIGLAIVRRVVEDHGGKITCRSDGETGTAFEIKLPV